MVIGSRMAAPGLRAAFERSFFDGWLHLYDVSLQSVLRHRFEGGS